MAQYNTLNIKLSNLQLTKAKLGIKHGTDVTLKFSSNVVGDSNDEKNFPHKLLLTNTQVLRLREAFASNSLANIKLSKTQLHKIGQSVGFWINGSSSSNRCSYTQVYVWIRHASFGLSKANKITSNE